MVIGLLDGILRRSCLLEIRSITSQSLPSTSLATFISPNFQIFALEQLHAQGVVHCNINPSSILINHLGAPCYTSFHVAEKFPSSRPFPYVRDRSQHGYLAPELAGALFVERSHQAADVWALGIVLLELYWGMRDVGIFRGHRKSAQELEDVIQNTDMKALPMMRALERRDAKLHDLLCAVGSFFILSQFEG